MYGGLGMANLGNQLELDRCPHCGTDRPNLYRVAHFKVPDAGGTEKVWVGYACARCGGAVFGWYWALSGSTYAEEVFPSPQVVDEAIPERARAYLAQALQSLSAPAGAVMLTASAVDALLKEKGYVDGSLHSRIDTAAKDHVITEDMAAWAHEIRLDANDQRHADVASQLPTTEDAAQTIEFATALGQFMFVLPSRVRRGISAAKGS
jgi:hypothetical protein